MLYHFLICLCPHEECCCARLHGNNRPPPQVGAQRWAKPSLSKASFDLEKCLGTMELWYSRVMCGVQDILGKTPLVPCIFITDATALGTDEYHRYSGRYREKQLSNQRLGERTCRHRHAWVTRQGKKVKFLQRMKQWLIQASKHPGNLSHPEQREREAVESRESGPWWKEPPDLHRLRSSFAFPLCWRKSCCLCKYVSIVIAPATPGALVLEFTLYCRLSKKKVYFPSGESPGRKHLLR